MRDNSPTLDSNASEQLTQSEQNALKTLEGTVASHRYSKVYILGRNDKKPTSVDVNTIYLKYGAQSAITAYWLQKDVVVQRELKSPKNKERENNEDKNQFWNFEDTQRRAITTARKNKVPSKDPALIRAIVSQYGCAPSEKLFNQIKQLITVIEHDDAFLNQLIDLVQILDYSPQHLQQTIAFFDFIYKNLTNSELPAAELTKQYNKMAQTLVKQAAFEETDHLQNFSRVRVLTYTEDQREPQAFKDILYLMPTWAPQVTSNNLMDDKLRVQTKPSHHAQIKIFWLSGHGQQSNKSINSDKLIDEGLVDFPQPAKGSKQVPNFTEITDTTTILKIEAACGFNLFKNAFLEEAEFLYQIKNASQKNTNEILKKTLSGLNKHTEIDTFLTKISQHSDEFIGLARSEPILVYQLLQLTKKLSQYSNAELSRHSVEPDRYYEIIESLREIPIAPNILDAATKFLEPFVAQRSNMRKQKIENNSFSETEIEGESHEEYKEPLLSQKTTRDAILKTIDNAKFDDNSRYQEDAKQVLLAVKIELTCIPDSKLEVVKEYVELTLALAKQEGATPMLNKNKQIETKQLPQDSATNPTSDNPQIRRYQELLNILKTIDPPRSEQSWGQKLASAGLIFLGTLLIGIGIAGIIGSLGITTPVSITAICIGCVDLALGLIMRPPPSPPKQASFTYQSGCHFFSDITNDKKPENSAENSLLQP